MIRPLPPLELCEVVPTHLFRPAPDLVEWAQSTFVDESAALRNPDHSHLESATIGALWTNETNYTKQRFVVATAEIPNFRCAVWQKRRQEAQLIQWFGRIPDFVLTFYAPYAAEVDDTTWCALVEHELYHCAQATTEFGTPRFRRDDGRPIFALRGHDAEEFVGVVRRYGPGAAAGGVAELVQAASRPPEIAPAQVAGVCGTCLARVA